MRILLLWPDRLRKDLGGPKIVVEVAEAMAGLGWETTLYDPWTLPDGRTQNVSWPERIRAFLHKEAVNYELIEYDHGHFPFPRAEFDAKPLFVARSGLLAHHFGQIKIPELNPWRNRLRRLVKGRAVNERYAENIALAHYAFEQADFINVSNEDDLRVLVAAGIKADKIGVFPFGMSADRRQKFAGISLACPALPKVAFVGSFDGRKGAVEFPRIVEQVVRELPQVQFKLVGTKGRFRTSEEVTAFFPASLHRHLEVIAEYPPDDLPRLLADCSVGIFPSYIEGFPFGVLEMLGAALPVIAYDAPGAPMMLAPEYLVPRGADKILAERVVRLLRDRNLLAEERQKAVQRSREFSWERTAQATILAYEKALAARRGLISP